MEKKELNNLLKEYKLAKKAEEEAKKKQEDIKKQLFAEMDEKETNILEGDLLSATRTFQSSSRVDSKVLKERFQGVYESVLVESQSTVLRVK